MTRVTVLVFLLAFLLALSAAAQRRGQSSGADRDSRLLSVDVRVVAENDEPVGESVRVQLLKFGGTPVAETMTIDGIAQFSGIQAGAYALRVSGVSIEETTTPVFEVRPAGLNGMQIVRVKMRSEGGTTGSTQGAVSAQDLNIPSKAKKEFDKAGDAMQNADWTKARRHLETAISLYPNYAAAYNNLGVVAMKQNEEPKAKAAFAKAVELNDSSGSAYLNLGRLYMRERNFEEAGRLVNRALSLDPSNPETLTILADCDLATGKYGEAIGNVRRVHAVPHERYAVAHLIAAAALEKQNHPQDATAEYKQFLKEDPNSPRAASARKALARLAATSQPGGAAPRP